MSNKEPKIVRKIREIMAGQTGVDYLLSDISSDDLEEAYNWAVDHSDDELCSMLDDELEFRKAGI